MKKRIFSLLLALVMALSLLPTVALADETPEAEPSPEQMEQPIAEEPIAEQPIVEEPIAEEPIVEQPIVEQPPEEEGEAVEEEQMGLLSLLGAAPEGELMPAAPDANGKATAVYIGANTVNAAAYGSAPQHTYTYAFDYGYGPEATRDVWSFTPAGEGTPAILTLDPAFEINAEKVIGEGEGETTLTGVVIPGGKGTAGIYAKGDLTIRLSDANSNERPCLDTRLEYSTWDWKAVIGKGYIGNNYNPNSNYNEMSGYDYGIYVDGTLTIDGDYSLVTTGNLAGIYANEIVVNHAHNGRGSTDANYNQPDKYN